jgi:nucleoside diphosphate kinase
MISFNYYQEIFELVAKNYKLISVEKDTKDYDFKKKYLSSQTKKFFKSLGGFEKTRQGVKFDLGCTIHTSVSPDKSQKKITYFFY